MSQQEITLNFCPTMLYKKSTTDIFRSLITLILHALLKNILSVLLDLQIFNTNWLAKRVRITGEMFSSTPCISNVNFCYLWNFKGVNLWKAFCGLTLAFQLTSKVSLFNSFRFLMERFSVHLCDCTAESIDDSSHQETPQMKPKAVIFKQKRKTFSW